MSAADAAAVAAAADAAARGSEKPAALRKASWDVEWTQARRSAPQPAAKASGAGANASVSYTHLTLPTKA